MLRHPDSNRDELSSSAHLRFDIPIIECYVYHSATSQCFPTSTWTGLFTLKSYHELFTLTGFCSRERSDGCLTTRLRVSHGNYLFYFFESFIPRRAVMILYISFQFFYPSVKRINHIFHSFRKVILGIYPIVI